MHLLHDKGNPPLAVHHPQNGCWGALPSKLHPDQLKGGCGSSHDLQSHKVGQMLTSPYFAREVWGYGWAGHMLNSICMAMESLKLQGKGVTLRLARC